MPRNPDRWWRVLVCCLALLAVPGAQAQFSMVPAPAVQGAPRASAAEIETEYRIDAARHVYAAFAPRIYRGKMPPLLYGIMMVETELDAAGQVLSINIVRKPAADEVAPWVLAMVKRAAPYPAPAALPGARVRFTETWFVHKSGQFQLFSLTEGQH